MPSGPCWSWPWAGDVVAPVGLRGRWGRRGEEERGGCAAAGVLVLLLLVIALARWGSGANFISLVSVVIASPEIVVAKGRAGWGRAGAAAPFLSICEECPK